MKIKMERIRERVMKKEKRDKRKNEIRSERM